MALSQFVADSDLKWEARITKITADQDAKLERELSKVRGEFSTAIQEVREELKKASLSSAASGAATPVSMMGSTRSVAEPEAPFVPRFIYIKGFVTNFKTLEGGMSETNALKYLRLLMSNLPAESREQINVEETLRERLQPLYTRLDIYLVDGAGDDRKALWIIRAEIQALIIKPEFRMNNGSRPFVQIQPHPDRRVLYRAGAIAMDLFGGSSKVATARRRTTSHHSGRRRAAARSRSSSKLEEATKCWRGIRPRAVRGKPGRTLASGRRSRTRSSMQRFAPMNDARMAAWWQPPRGPRGIVAVPPSTTFMVGWQRSRTCRPPR